MNGQGFQSKAAYMLAGGALVMAGYLIGAGQGAAEAQEPKDEARQVEAAGCTIGVSIPNGGGALVKGADGNAYVVDQRGLYVRASQAGKPLPLE